MSFSIPQKQLFLYATVIPSSISIMGSIYIIVDIVRTTKRISDSKVNNKIVLTMCIFMIVWYSGMVQSQAVLLIPTACQVQALLIQFGEASLPLLGMFQALHYYLILSGKDPKDYLYWFYVGISVSYSIATCLLCLGLKAFGDATLWCWIKPQYTQMRMLLFYIPLWCCIFLTILFVSLGVRSVGRQAIEMKLNPRETRKLKRIASKAFVYAAVFVLTWIPATINRVVEMIYGASPVWMRLIHTIMVTSSGTLTALGYYYLQFYSRHKTQSIGAHSSTKSMCAEA